MKEVEKRVFISDTMYSKFLVDFGLVDKTPERQITTYFDANNNDLRLMNTLNYSKIWLKSGSIHDDCREEHEVFFDNKYANEMFKILSKLFKVKTKWFRERHIIRYKEATLCLDRSINYGAILELEILTENDESVEQSSELLNQYLSSLGLTETKKEYANEKFVKYINEWKSYDFPKDELSWLKNGEIN